MRPCLRGQASSSFRSPNPEEHSADRRVAVGGSLLYGCGSDAHDDVNRKGLDRGDVCRYRYSFCWFAE